MNDDRNPAFVREFYSTLRCICHDLFMARARPSNVDAATHPLASLLGKGTAEERTTIVHDLIDLRTETSADSPADTAAKYGGFLSAAALQKALGPAAAAAGAAHGSDGDADMGEWVRLLGQELDLKEQLARGDSPALRERLRLCAARKDELAARIAAAGKR